VGKFRESRTARNLLTSFAGESQARNRYTYFARRAHEESLAQIGDIFEETAGQECEHALRFFNFFITEDIVSCKYPYALASCRRMKLPPSTAASTSGSSSRL